mgnify:CR=1
MREKRDEILILRITKTEKMYGIGIRSLSAYIPSMVTIMEISVYLEITKG